MATAHWQKLCGAFGFGVTRAISSQPNRYGGTAGGIFLRAATASVNNMHGRRHESRRSGCRASVLSAMQRYSVRSEIDETVLPSLTTEDLKT